MATVRDSGFRKLPVPPFDKVRRHVNRRALSLVLVIVGAGLLGYVASQYWFMYHTQRSLEAEWERQAASATAAGHGAAQAAGQALTRMLIPKINLDAIVLEGASRKQLSLGPGHITNTPLPGETGNAVITGHRDTFFRHIFELGKGDEIDVQRNGQVFRYRVTDKKIVNPDDVSVLNRTGDAQLTLITCYPIYYVGPAPQRLVVFSKLASNDSSNPAAHLLQ
jgi:sortase A